MKYVWEACDIICGRRVMGANRAENSVSVIGYQFDPDNGKAFRLISLSDGNIWYKAPTKEILAQCLTDMKLRPVDIVLPDIMPQPYPNDIDS